MKKAVGILSVLLAFTIAVNAVIPTMSVSIKDAVLRRTQVASLNDFIRDNSGAEAETAAGTASDQKEAAYEDGKILIYNYDQLLMIGSGKSYEYDDGVTATYALDSEYMLARDISLPRHTVWQLPDGFKGKITGKKPGNAPLYDKEVDRIYLYNPYQLSVMAMEDRENQPVMSGDADASTFGTGKVICTDDDNKCYLTYSDDRNYVISAGFNSEVTEKSPSVVRKKSVEEVGASSDDDSVGAQTDSPVGAMSDGRDFDGQVIKKIGNDNYILIGNKEQLRLIGSNEKVWTRAYKMEFDGFRYVVDKDNSGNDIVLYGGDADWDSVANGAFQKIGTGTNTYPRAGVDQTTGEAYTNGSKVDGTSAGTARSWITDETYSSDANYIIFRDIDLGGDANDSDTYWTPIMYRGIMKGAKSVSGEKLWNGSGITDSTAITATASANRPVIKNVYVKQAADSPVNVNNYIGVGFFATISNKPSDSGIGLSGGTATVKNLELQNVHVENNTTQQVKNVNDTLLNKVTTGLGLDLTEILVVLVNILSLGSIPHDNLKGTLSTLLNARPDNPTALATGTFAGRIYGDVLVEDCLVSAGDSGTVSVSNVNDRTGGFVGYTEGVTEYSGLSNALKGASGLLADVLNIIPGIGLGDLVTILLDNGLALGNLVPTGYKAPQIKNCGVNGLTGVVGSSDKEFAGGFAGVQIGTRIENSTVANSSFTVKAANYGGGFSGLSRDAVITSTLDGIGLDAGESILTKLKDLDVHTQSVLVDCTISGWKPAANETYNVTGGNMQGGFVGAMTKSYAVDCTIECSAQGENPDAPIKIKATGDDAGGFAGYATVGWSSSLGDANDQKGTLLGTVGTLLSSLLSTDAQAQKLLTLMGVSPSAILGCRVYSNGLEVEAASKAVSGKTVGGNNAGGLVGRGDAVYIGTSDAEAFTQLAKWNSGTIKETPDNKTVILSGVSSVSTAQSCAGGVAGYVCSAAFQGLLNNVAGLGDFIGFTVRDVSLTGVGSGYTVTAGNEKAGGGFGLAVGGTITNVNLNELKKVQAYNRAGGFVGVAGPGELVGTGGLTVNLLGLDRLVKANNLLNVGQGVEVHITNCNVTGISNGFDVCTTGTNSGDNSADFIAAGFIADSNSTKITNSHVDKLNTVISDTNYGYAGGFIGMSSTGGLAEVADLDNVSIGSDTPLEDGYYLIKAGYNKTDIIGMFTSDSKIWGEYILNANLTQGETIKVVQVQNNEFTTWYPESGDGYTVDAEHSGAVTVHFSKTKKTFTMDLLDYHLKIEQDEDNLHGLDQFIDKDSAVLDVNGLVNAISYLIPSYTNCTTTFINTESQNKAYVSANVAGGFVADLESGTVDNTNISTVDSQENPKWTKSIRRVYDPNTVYAQSEGNNHSETVDKQFAVFNINKVYGGAYGGGFGGKLRSGALANAGKGISILGDLKIGNTKLSIDLNNLASVINTYVPYVKHAGVYSENGFTVTANTLRDNDSRSGSAGGFAGLMSGAQVSDSDVYQLKKTSVDAPADLESDQADSYFSDASHYAVTGGRYAGGYVGNADIGSAASVGDGLGVLGSTVSLADAVSALSIVVTTIEHSDVQGAPGGFSALADNTDSTGKLGKAGGFAGESAGAHIQNSHCKNFYYIIGQEAAGGYVGSLKPGDAASLLGEAGILDLITVNGSLATLLEDFVPTIRNSTTSCVPCGGAVRADAKSDTGHQRGCAGGYCGHNEGGSIWGLDSHTWQRQNDGAVGSMNFGHSTEGSYTGEKHTAAAWRIRSVYGAEYAGGYTGFMEAADTASTGNISLLGGLLLNASNPLSILSVVYPTEKNTAVYGPLKNVDADTWDKWVKNIARYGGYGLEIAQKLRTNPQSVFTEDAKYYYGCNVVAGRSVVSDIVGDNETWPITEGGDAGGYVGLMRSGVITNGQSHDMKEIKAMRAAGGFAGSMQTGGAASFGNVSLLDNNLNLNLSQLIPGAVQVFVPKVESSSVEGWQSGLTVTAKGAPSSNSNNNEGNSQNPDLEYRCGCAGGYAGAAYGAQIWGNKDTKAGCNVSNLRKVSGTNAAGGYAGLTTAASVADVNSHTTQTGLVQGILDTLVTTPADLANVLNATITTIKYATVDAADKTFGFVVKGDDKTPLYAGGFAGTLAATIIGEEDYTDISESDSDEDSVGTEVRASDIVVNDLRSVDGKYYAGGFFGYADVTGVAEVSDNGKTSILMNAVTAEQVDVLSVFRPKVYKSEVNGVSDGIVVRADTSASLATLSETRYSGCAGGFGGAMMNGVVDDSKVTNLNKVEGLNYVGGFIGHMGKSGVVNADQVGALNDLVNLTAGVIDVFSTHTTNCEVTGIASGAVINAASGTEPIAGGFAGYADVSKINSCQVNNLKLVNSDQIPGGFVGKTDMHYLINVEANSLVVNILLNIVNVLVKGLYLTELEQTNLINAELGSIAGLNILSNGDLIKINLLGLIISVSLVKAEEDSGLTDTAVITIGDSVVALPCNKDGLAGNSGDNANVVINLIKGNRTRIDGCTVTGIGTGYDVYGGGADNAKDGTHVNGMAGGFVGYNHEGKLLNNNMVYCDVVRGTAKLTGPFSGKTDLNSVYNFNTINAIEGENNTYHVYRVTDKTRALTGNNQQIGTGGTDGSYKRFDVTHLAEPITLNNNETYDKVFGKWNGAKLAAADSTDNASLIKVYVSNAKAVLMLDTPFGANDDSLVPDPGDKKDPCIKTIDLTVQKIWNDDNNENGSRPAEIKVKLWQQAYNENGEVQGQRQQYTAGADPGGWFIISAANHGRADSATWTRVIEGLPVVVQDEQTQAYTYYTYEVEEAPVIGYNSNITPNETSSTPTATITNTPKDFVIEFKYYDRYHDYMTAAGINEEPTTYSMTLKGIPSKFIKSEVIDYSGLIGDKAVEFSEKLAVNNLICDYDLWTSQEAAVSALNGERYFYFDGENNGAHVRYNNQICHTDYLGKPQTSDTEKWVNYYDSVNNEITEENAKENANLDVSKIVVWCYNYPKQYTADIYGADDISDVTEKTVGDRKVYVADYEETNNRLAGSDAPKFYYNQRFGGVTNDWNSDLVSGKDNAGFIEKYGLKAYTNVMPAEYTAESFTAEGTKYNFAYWAYDREGTQIASVERSFGYRVTANTKLYAVYAAEGSDPGISISADSNDTYVDGNGISRTRLNIFGSVYGAVDYDTNVKKISFVNISLSTQIRDNPEVYTPEKINALFEQYKAQLKQIIQDYDTKYGSQPFSVAHTYDGDIGADNKVDSELQLTLTTKGFIYTVVSNGNTPEKQNDKTIKLTNKNRALFTANYKTSALNINNTGTNGNTCLLFCGAVKYNNDWKVSTNCLIYYNGKAINNTDTAWTQGGVS